MTNPNRKLAIIDRDGILADRSEAFAQAEASGLTRTGDEADGYWAIIFDNNNILADKVIPGALEALQAIEAQGWHVIIMTSIPYRVHHAVSYWLEYTFGWTGNRDLIMKPNALQKNSTPNWKANTVQALSTVFGQILFVDDEEKNIDAVLSQNQIKWRMDKGYLQVTTATSLAQALEAIKPPPPPDPGVDQQLEIEAEDVPFSGWE